MGTARTACTVATLLVATPARAEAPPTAQLHYQFVDAQGCPNEASLRNAVAARLGYDPFRPDASRKVVASIEREGHGLRALVELRGADGTLLGMRRLSSATTDCGELASSMTLAISITIDPMAIARPERVVVLPPPVSPPPAAPPPAAPPPAAPSPAAAQKPRLPPSVAKTGPAQRKVAFTTEVAGAAAVGSLPDATFRVGFGVGARWRRASVNVEGAIDLPATKMVTGAVGVRGMLLMALLVPCFHQQVSRTEERVVLAACGLGAIGALQGEGLGVIGPNHATTLYGALGARFGVELRLTRWLFGGLSAALLVPLSRTTLRVGDIDAWTAPPVSGAFALTLGAHIR